MKPCLFVPVVLFVFTQLCNRACAEPGGAAAKVMLRMDAVDAGLVLKHGDGPGGCDAGGARDVTVTEWQGTYYLYYDGAGPTGWLACLATSRDLAHWTKKGPMLSLGPPGSDDSASASYGVPFGSGRDWRLFYLATPAATAAPDFVPSPPYMTMIARGTSPAGPWTKEAAVPFRPGDMSAKRYGARSIVNACPGTVVKSGDEYLMFFTWGGYSARTGPAPVGGIAIARTKDLEGKWTIGDKPILPGNLTCENASVYYEPTNQTWFLFTNHIGPGYTDAAWVYWSKDLEKWDPANRAIVLDGKNCTWSKRCIGLPSVVKVGDRLAVLYDAPSDNGTSHMGRDVGLAWLPLPLSIPKRP